ncbi:UNVERIFIED_CONTAM: pimeloyl-ACP methyl ester carboxylesterase/DNA-binding SARP family transcriptional activator [Brevibacillus sp. OAP136]
MYLVRNGIKIHYKYRESIKVMGNGGTIVLIHGMGMDMSCWEDLTPFLVYHYNVLQFDLRGHGGSGHGSEEIQLATLCDDLDVLVDAVGVKEFHLIGHGFGGFVAMKYATRQPKRVKTLHLISTPLYYPPSLIDNFYRYRRSFCVNGNMQELGSALAKQICHPLTQEKLDKLRQSYAKTNHGTYFQFIDLLAEEITNAILLKQIQQLELPVLLLSGELDLIYPLNLYTVGTLFFQYSRLRVVPNASNAVQMDQPGVVAEWIDLFITQYPKESRFLKENAPEVLPEIREEFLQMFQLGIHKLESSNKLVVNVVRGFQVELNGELLTGAWNQRNAKDLLMYLVFHPSVTREQLYDLYWPTADLDKAQNNLRVALNHLKKLLATSKQDSEVLQIDRDLIQLTGIIQCDLILLWEEIERTLHETDEITRLALIEGIYSRLPETLIPGFYSDWMLAYRGKLEDELVSLAQWGMDFCQRNNDYKRALQFIDASLKLRPYDDVLESKQKLMQKRLDL